jgi:altronate dehydratase small subunit
MEEKINALIIKSADSVAVAIDPLQAGEVAAFTVNGKVKNINIIETIPVYHKFAVLDIAEGQEVFKYGESIGRAISAIQVGQHVHTHNLVSIREGIAK